MRPRLDIIPVPSIDIRTNQTECSEGQSGPSGSNIVPGHQRIQVGVHVRLPRIRYMAFSCARTPHSRIFVGVVHLISWLISINGDVENSFYSDIYSTPRLAESLENVISLGNGNNGNITNTCTNGSSINGVASNSGSLGSALNQTSGSTGSSLNVNSSQTQRYRIDALATTSSASPINTSTTITPTMDGIGDSKLRQGERENNNFTEVHFFRSKLVVAFRKSSNLNSRLKWNILYDHQAIKQETHRK